ncbi:MAG: hypothetical protein A2X86_09835 [Bdellovibrionales bacterium GWA2_49_15]|nr:MAG: hypothetical protein A2X86_09835 [Bdellovibrionales bacterium GWA2_49_15]HAZ13083.1 hypothetical protein [Bdellovibrionales bacterium]
MKRFAYIIFLTFFSLTVKAQSSGNISQKNIQELVDSGIYFGTIPFIKETLYSSGAGVDAALNEFIDEIVSHVGLRQFSALSIDVLERSRASTLRYVLAKKYFNKGDYNSALSILDGLERQGKDLAPFISHMKASALAILKKSEEAARYYDECARQAEKVLGSGGHTVLRKRQLVTLRDSCIVGIARMQFASAKFDKSILSYLDLQKKSPIWPEILFEEAWASFYTRDFNRTLGKLVTYKAPVLDYIFNPEIEVLSALTYLEMCLFDDAKKSADNFYTKYQRGYLGLLNLIGSMKSDYRSYYALIKQKDKVSFDPLIIKLLNDIWRDPATQELFQQIEAGKHELTPIKAIGNAKLKIMTARNLKDSLILQRDIIGRYVKKRLVYHARLLDRSFEDMSYIKLEILSKMKGQILGINGERARGDIKFLERNEKQYFWTFNGEFWADELGDYVFALKSECGNEVAKN